MPWCPKCKTEYRSGFEICVDCGAELTDDAPPELLPAKKQDNIPTHPVLIALMALGASITALVCYVFAMMTWARTDIYGFTLGIAITAVTGFIFGYNCSRRLTLPALTIGWILPFVWLFPFIFQYGWEGLSFWDGLLKQVILTSFAIAVPAAGIIGSLLGTQSRRKPDWLRLIVFALIVPSLVIYFGIAIEAAGRIVPIDR